MTKTLILPSLILVCLAGYSSPLVQLYAGSDGLRVSRVTVDNQLNKATEDQAGREKEDEELLTPLTPEERLLVPRDVIAGQPDFVANLNFFVSHGSSGFGGSERVARKGSRFRDESENWIFIGEIGKTTARLYSRSKTYDEMQPLRVQAGDNSFLSLKLLVLDPNVTFAALGTIEISGHHCIKIEAIGKDKVGKMYLYAARDLNNLVIVSRIIDPKRSMIERLDNISFEVPNSLFEIPPDFKPMEHDRWTKMESARVTYKDKPSHDFGVFRAPGGELFIWVNDAYYPWHYLVRPQKATVEIAFQGLLVNRTGEYIWRTKETEAFSQTNYLSFFGPAVDTHVVVTSNSVKFRSNNYDRDNAMIEVSW